METFETTVHTLVSLAEALPKPKDELRAALLAGVTDAQLVRLGRTIDSSRVTTDAERLYGLAYAFWLRAGKAQRLTLRGFSEDLLAIAVREALDLTEKKRSCDAAGQHEDEARARRAAQAVRALEEALMLRDQADHVLRDVAGGDEPLLEEVAHRVGTSEDEEALALGLERLAALGEEILAVGGAELKRRAHLFAFDVAYVAQLTAAAASLRKASTALGARGGKPVNQGALDRLDGINIRLLMSVVRAFESAHERDASIPRLIPIATRQLFSRRSVKAAAKGDAGHADDPRASAVAPPVGGVG